VSLKDLFSKQGRRDRSLAKSCAKAIDKKIKPEDRRPALWNLLEEARGVETVQAELAKLEGQAAGGKPAEREAELTRLRGELEEAQRRSVEAVNALMRRFTFIYDTNIVNDEEEKDMVYEGLVALGDRILPEVRRHLKDANTLSWGLRVLTEITDPETSWGVVAEVLKDYEPGYERDPSRKLQLMNFLGDFKDPRSVDGLLPYLEDQDEGVRYVTVESLFKQGDERAREPLLQLMTSEEEESLRIKHRIAEGFAAAGWLVKGFRGTVEKILPPEYVVDGKGKIKLKKARDDDA